MRVNKVQHFVILNRVMLGKDNLVGYIVVAENDKNQEQKFINSTLLIQGMKNKSISVKDVEFVKGTDKLRGCNGFHLSKVPIIDTNFSYRDMASTDTPVSSVTTPTPSDRPLQVIQGKQELKGILVRLGENITGNSSCTVRMTQKDNKLIGEIRGVNEPFATMPTMDAVVELRATVDFYINNLSSSSKKLINKHSCKLCKKGGFVVIVESGV